MVKLSISPTTGKQKTENREKFDLFQVENVFAAPFRDEFARYNATRFHGFTALRINRKPPEEGGPDFTDSIGLYFGLRSGDSKTYCEVLGRNRLKTDVINIEDLRAFPFVDDGVKKVRFGLTAVGRDKQPYPAILDGHYPFFGDHCFNQPIILHDLPPGKNVCPFSRETIMYRQEGAGKNHALTLARQEGKKWIIERDIDFPKDLGWARFRIGLTGSQWIEQWREGAFNKGILLIHGVNKANVSGKDDYEYALGLAELEWQEDFNNLRLISVSEEPLLSYGQMKRIYTHKFGEDRHIELNGYKRVIYSCDGGVERVDDQAVKRMHFLVTYGDTQVVEVSTSKEYILKFGRKKVLSHLTSQDLHPKQGYSL